MEDVLALILVAAIVSIAVYIVYKFVTHSRQRAQAIKDRSERVQQHLEKMRADTAQKIQAEEQARRELRKHRNYGMPEFDPKNPDVLKPRETVVQQKSRFRNEEVTPAPVNNWSNDLLTTMVIADMLTNHKDVSAGTVSWKDDTPTITETYSKPSTDFGFDDSDSRKSSSSSFSSSDSSSSWSSSSSSDSGPSSDW